MPILPQPNSQAQGALDALTVIVVTFNSAHCLADLGANLRAFPNVTVVDNDSDDETAAAVRHHLPQALFIPNDRNLGFGAANNRALDRVATPYALLLNPDCSVSVEAVHSLVEAARAEPGAAMVVPQLVRPSGAPEVNYRWPSSRWVSRGPGADGPCCVGFACGAALLLNMSVMSEVGFFDEAFFLYYEDDDLCTRVFEAGKAMMLIPAVRLVHASRGSVRGRHPWRSEYLRGYHHAQSKVRYTAKYEGLAGATRLRRKVLALALFGLPLRLLLPAPRQVARLVGRVAGLWRLRVRELPTRRH
jgi:N-acetylglucosaminyl-diphospho-decaprenol L-rhamnosyltransferase